ncbi:MAG: ATP-binding protein [Corticimicrobacter sp.]|uniref:sensor histidine kinase n=1 Tax=Corticimicrobacter sp. TaxID=2678536 RepID=UPI0032DB594E
MTIFRSKERLACLRRLLPLVLLWCVVLAVAVGMLAAWQYRDLASELEQEGTLLHRLVSQRVSQHDAHLTALSAIASAATDSKHDLFLEVAQSIERFYPRIDDIQLVPLDSDVRGTGLKSLPSAEAQQIRAAAHASTGQVVLMADADHADHYVMIKRSPNTDAALYGLMLAVDARALIAEAAPFWSMPNVMLQLSLPDGHVLVGEAQVPAVLQFKKTIANTSQPLVLTVGYTVSWADLLPPWPTVLVLSSVSVLYLVAVIAWRQRGSVRAAMTQARLSALESRLAHASRVNTLGEMASGLTHELTQPLTAILAQAQASRRILDKGQSEMLATVLNDTVTQARRASAILERFRQWSNPQRTPSIVFDVREALENVRALLAPQAAACNVKVECRTLPVPAFVRADPVEMEQVMFNLVRNAIEAVADQGPEGRVVLALAGDGERVVFEVSDNGAGISDEVRSKLFTPFATTRAGGMGLGLALSQRLVESAGGEIGLVGSTQGAVFRVVLPRQPTPTEVKS